MAKGLKTGGREKGTPNKLTTAIRETLVEVLQGYTSETLLEDLNSLTPVERLRAITGLYKLSLPPIRPYDDTSEVEMKPIVLKFIDGSLTGHE
jgi:hypothetical protein